MGLRAITYGALAGGGAAALVEAGLAFGRHHGGVGVWAATSTASLGLWVALLPVLGAALLLVEAMVRHPLARAARRRWPGWALARPLGLLALLAGLGGAAIYGFIQVALPALRDQFNDPALVPPVLGVTSVAVVLLGVGLLSAAAPALMGLTSRVPAPLVGALGGLSGLAVLIIALWTPASIFTRMASWTPVLSSLTALTVGLCVHRRPPSRLRWWLPLLPIGAAAAGLAVVQADLDVRLALTDSRGLGAWVAEALRAAGDADADGYGRWLGGGDCDDTDPLISPGALDLADNGVDEDCDGADRRRPAAAARGSAPHHPLPPLLQKRWNLLVLTVDALRPDHLGAYGYRRPTSPNIDALAQRSVLFERAWSLRPKTVHALPEMWIGRPWDRLQIEGEGLYAVLGPGNHTLFERLGAAGYHTEAHLPAWMTDRMLYGLGQGMSRLEVHAELQLKQPSGEALTDLGIAAAERLVGGDAPWALWLHYLDPHSPFQPPTRPWGDARINRYDGEILATDAAIGRLFRALARSGALKDTVVVLTADHGEAFGEHGLHHHGRQVYEEGTRVPLLISVPGLHPRESDAPVSLIDLPETIANLFGLPPGPADGGRSLVPALLGEPLPPRPILLTLALDPQRPRDRLFGYIEWPWKLVHDVRAGHSRLFRLDTDPRERTDLAREIPRQTAALLTALRARHGADSEARLEWLRGRYVRRAPPDAAWAAEPIGSTGLSWLGGLVEPVEFSGGRLDRVRQWLRAERPPDADLVFELTYRRADGSRIERRRYRPLAGLYPTGRWAAGEVIEDVRHERFHSVIGGPVQVEIAFYVGGARVFGPRPLTRR